MIQYAGGTNVNSTFTCTTGTRREVVDGLVAALAAAGWSAISGWGTGDVLMQSATTPAPQSLQIQCRVYDPGSVACARVQMRNVAGTKITGDFWLLTAVGKVYRVIANRYQWFCMTAAPCADREFVCMGVPWIPSWLCGVITGDCGWIQGNATQGGSDAIRVSFRTALHSGGAYQRWAGLVNNNLLDSNDTAGRNSDLRLIIPWPTLTDYTTSYCWHDDSQFLSEPLIGWGLLYTSDDAKVRGQLWDAVVLSGTQVADQTYAINGKTWWGITHNNVGSAFTARGTLLVVVPTP